MGQINWGIESNAQRKARRKQYEEDELWMRAVQLARITGAVGFNAVTGAGGEVPPRQPAMVNKSTPAGLVDGLNTQFILEYEPIPGSDHLYMNGLLQDNEFGGDYMINKNIITFDEPPIIGSVIKCTYMIFI
jgi:hypothetical protein